jgi:glycine/D-amino acid oxidase-like deaminating enzyme
VKQIAIVGGGIVGIATAYALSRRRPDLRLHHLVPARSGIRARPFVPTASRSMIFSSNEVLAWST